MAKAQPSAPVSDRWSFRGPLGRTEFLHRAGFYLLAAASLDVLVFGQPSLILALAVLVKFPLLVRRLSAVGWPWPAAFMLALPALEPQLTAAAQAFFVPEVFRWAEQALQVGLPAAALMVALLLVMGPSPKAA